QIYTDWANHYLVKSGHKQLIKDLQQDVSDGVLLAEIIQVVANEKIEDINGCPNSHSQMVENIDTCLTFLAAKGVNIQGISAEEIRNGNLKAILGLFFSLSRYKQQQQQQQSSSHTHFTHTPTNTAHTQVASSHETHSSASQIQRAQTEMQSRLPGPTSRVPAVCVESRGSVSSAGNRRSQTFTEKIKPISTQTRESLDAIASQPSMNEHTSSSLATTSIVTSTVPSSSSSSSTSSSAIPQPNSCSKPWRSKSLSAKNAPTSTVSSVKGEVFSKQASPIDPPHKSLSQKSMLEKLKLFNSKSVSKTSTQQERAVQMSLISEKVEAPELLEEANGNALTSNSPKMALKGIAQRTFSRALTAKKGSVKSVEKEKDHEKEKERAKEKEKDKGKDSSKRLFTFEKAPSREAASTEEVTDRSEVSKATEPKRTSKIASLIPKGGKMNATKDSSTSVHSGIPKPGSKSTAKSLGVPFCGKDNERPRSMRLSSGVGFHVDSHHSSSSSSLASTEGKAHHTQGVTPISNGGTTQSTASNTVSVQLPQPQQQYNHPNTATVAPFMYRSQTEGDDIAEKGSTGHTGELGSFSKTSQMSTEDLSSEDPETRRLRTVKNIADLRQNLEETMSSLRGTQITHSALETFDSGGTTETNGRGFRSSRAAPLSWTNRISPSSPRLQAGDAPSPGNGYPAHGGMVGAALGHTRYLYSAPLRRQLVARSSAICGLELGEQDGEELQADVSGYVSDGDMLTKNTHTDELSSGYLTDGGLSLYTRRMNRFPDGLALMRETLQKHVSTGQGDADSWDDSSSVSSGISDTIDTDDINTSSSISLYTHTSASCRVMNTQPQTDSEKHLVAERNSSWSCDEVKKSDRGSDSSLKMESGSKNSSDVWDKGGSGKRSGATSQTGSWRRGMSAQVGVTSPRTKNLTVTSGPGVMKAHGTAKTDDSKVSEKGHISPHTNNIQSCDPVSSRVAFGFKKPTSGSISGLTVTATTSTTAMVSASRVTVISGSATLGKIPKSTALMVGGARSGVKGSTPECAMVTQEDGGLATSVRSTPQYRSLPRPSRSSHNRSSTSSIESGSSGRGPASNLIVSANKIRESIPNVKTNQTDKEKGGVSEMDNLRANVVGSSLTIPQTAGQGCKYTEVSSPTLRRLFGGKAAKQASATDNLKNSVVISNPHATLAHHSVPSAGLLDSSSAGSSLGAGGSEQVSSPGSGYSGGTGTCGHPSVSSMHTSSESIDMSVSSGHHRDNGYQPITRTGSVKMERYTPSPQLRPEEARDWLRSHSISGLQDSASNSPFSTGSSLTSPSGTRFNFGQLASPTTVAQINLVSLRNSSLNNQDAGLDMCNETRLRNSCVSLDEKTRIMSRSASFRDGFEEVHGSSLSLVSSTSSIYSTNEEKSQSEIRKLRRELDASQEKVSALTTQLSANAHLVAAFEQSLANMTFRLKSLTMTAEQKDSELNELRKTIELLKKQNAVAQAAINGVINTPELACKPERTGSVGSVSVQAEMCMRRQHSSDSVSSITSHSSMENTDNCSKKKKKNWLRSSFKQAFTKKKSPKSASSHSDIEEMNDSLPSSPKLPHNRSSSSTPMLRNSNSLLPEGFDGEAETVMQLRSELREKEMKLTDIRLEALSSAHQLDQLREAMNRMQTEIEKLKAENDHLKMEYQANGGRALITPSSNTTSTTEFAQQNLHKSTSFDILMDDSGGDGSFHKDGQHVKIIVTLRGEDAPRREDCRARDFLIGCIGVSGKTKWDVLDGVVKRLFKEYIRHVDPVSHLGLSSDSVEAYRIGELIRPCQAETPELLPCGYLVGENNTINISLKGVNSQSTDSLVFDMLIPKPVLQRYVSLLQEHRRLILSGFETNITYQHSQIYISDIQKPNKNKSVTNIATFLCKDTQKPAIHGFCQCFDLFTINIACSSNHSLPDTVQRGVLFSLLVNRTFDDGPQVLNGVQIRVTTDPQKQNNKTLSTQMFCRWVLCANHTEPVKGFLGRFLRRKLIETEISSRTRNPALVKITEWIPHVWHHLNCFLEAHSSSDVTIGPRLFLSCPMDVDGSRIWFTDLWNYSIIPYILEAVREGLQLYGRRAVWEDPARWVMDTFPWRSSSQHPDWPALLKLRPEDVGLDGGSTLKEGANKQNTQSDSDADPLMNMLMRLKEAANCSSTQSYDSDSNSNGHHDDILDSSLESTL
ncbi:neuron navigator 2 isoform X8, partial [Silurus asotus]